MDAVLIVIAGLALFAAGYVLGVLRVGKRLAERLKQEQDAARRNKYYLQIYDVWMMAKKYGRALDEYLLARGIHKIAIYGMDDLGVRLYHELKDTPVVVAYALDKAPKFRLPGLPVCRWDGAPPAGEAGGVDAVIVAESADFDAVAPGLNAAGYETVIGLDEVLYDLMREDGI